jgi:hypothetical protein
VPLPAAALVANDTLGKSIRAAATLLCRSSWAQFVAITRGRRNLAPHLDALPHPAAHLLHHLGAHGAAVHVATPPWTLAQRDHTMARGSHQSATLHYAFLRDEMADMVAKGYWTVVPYRLVRNLPRLRLSPIGVIPQRDRRPRTIVDYSFWGVNDDTVRLGPQDALQFGRALRRLLRRIRFAPHRHGPVYMLKLDVADGYYRLWLRAHDVPVLGVAFPHLPGKEPLVALPLVLPMGWAESAAYFCAATETAADLANTRCAAGLDPPRHHLEALASTPPASPPDGRPVHVLPPLARPRPLSPPPTTAAPASGRPGTRRARTKPTPERV